MKWWKVLQARSGYMNEMNGEGGDGSGSVADLPAEGGATEEDDLSWLFDDGDDNGGESPAGEGGEEGGTPEGDEGTPKPEGEEGGEPEGEGKKSEGEEGKKTEGDKGSDEGGKPEGEEGKKPEGEAEKKPEEEEPALSQEELEKRKNDFLAEVEKDFAISEEDSNLLLQEPEKVLPKMFSKVYDRAMQDATKLIHQQVEQLPQYLEQFEQQKTQQDKMYTDFLESNPVLKEVDSNELTGLIETFAPAIKSRMGNASPEEKMKELGRAIAAYKGLSAKPAPQQQQKKPAPAPKPHTPAAPAGSSVEGGKPKPASDVEAWILENLDD